MSTYKPERYHTPEGKARQKRANQRLDARRKLAWQWLVENQPDVIQQIIKQVEEEIQ
jgi:hypothetical protein